jgi:hypothetical protein
MVMIASVAEKRCRGTFLPLFLVRQPDDHDRMTPLAIVLPSLLTALAVLAGRFGADTRDGRDWQPARPGDPWPPLR